MRLFDLHCDTLHRCVTNGISLKCNDGHIDLLRGGKFEKYGQVFAAWIPDGLCPQAAWSLCRNTVLTAGREETHSDGCVRFFRKGEKLDKLFEISQIVGILAVENGAGIGGDLSRIDELSDLGVKYITITWNDENELGNGCLSPHPEGLTPFGKSAVRRMEKCGIVPDVSHLNERGFWDVAEAAKGVFIASHSNAMSVCAHPRNLTDAQFCEIVRRGGVVGLNFCRDHLGEQSFERLERHLDRFLSLGGENAVAFGGDLDGTALSDDWRDLSVMSRIYEFFYRKNYDTALLQKLFFGNCYNFFLRL